MKDVLDNASCIPIHTTKEGKAQCVRACCYKDGSRNIVGNQVDRKSGVAVPVLDEPDKMTQVGSLPRPNGELSKSCGMRVFSIDGKGRCLIANGGGAWELKPDCMPSLLSRSWFACVMMNRWRSKRLPRKDIVPLRWGGVRRHDSAQQ